ncbi:MAG: hypothetical protein IJX27_00270 [Clostridia bacterium]|nr:hypothetical protein [Clostridia bacterium]
MKNRKSILVAFLLCATLLVGVGYAAFTGNLIINGTATYTHDGSELDEDVFFSGYENLKHCNVSFADPDTATLEVTFTPADSLDGGKTCVATATLIITNTSTTTDVEFDATALENIVVNSADTTTSIFDVEASLSNTTLAANSTIKVDVTVTANIQGISESRTGTFVIQLPATEVTG